LRDRDCRAPARVWEALITRDQLGRWWHREEDFHVKSWEIDARDGGEWKHIAFDSTGKFVKPGITDFIMQGKILEFVPPRRLVMTWEANFHEIPWKRTLVVWELTPSENGTRVKVTHSGLKDLAVDRKDYAGGWPGVLEQLRNYVESVS
jgi:uncharacterized protein YndB with AHSA1/START domain